MADKDINIHVRAPGVEQVSQGVDKAADSLRNMGSAAADINRSTDKAFADGMKTIEERTAGAAASTSKMSQEAGILGSAFNMLKSHVTGLVAGLIAFGTIRFAKSLIAQLDEIIKKQEEAVQKNLALRKSYEDLFEVTNQFSEQGRKKTVKETEKLLAETKTPADVGMPAIEEYARQFKDQMKPADYQAGQRQVLSYAARHGGEATPDIIQMMRGYGMNTTAQQGEFMRTITAAGGKGGLTDREMIDAMGRAAPGARAMNISPQETISMVAAIASGEIGRNKTAMPATVIDALASPQAEAMKKYKIKGETPQDIYSAVRQKSQGMSANDKYKMLQDVYGDSAAKGIYTKLLGGFDAVRPVPLAVDQEEAHQYRQTMEGKQARTDAQNRLDAADTTPKEERFARGAIRAKAISEKYAREHPWKSWAIEHIPGPEVLKDAIATDQYLKEHPDQQPSVVNQTYHNNTIINQTPPDAQLRSQGGL